MERRLEEDVPCADIIRYLQALLGHSLSHIASAALGKGAVAAAKGVPEAADTEATPDEGQRRRKR